jgi:Golgi phosphoprotein 3 (GPP34)
MSLTLADLLLLIAYDDDGTRIGNSQAVDLGLGGAVLAELAIAGRIEVSHRRIRVVDTAPTGDPLLDGALAGIAAERRPRKPADLVGTLSRGLRATVLHRLVDQGILRREEGRVLWVFPRTRYPSATGLEPVAETDARGRLVLAVDGGGPVEPRVAALCGLVKAVGLEGAVFPDRPRREIRRRLDAVAESDWASAAVRRAISEVDAAVVASIAATTVISSG